MLADVSDALPPHPLDEALHLVPLRGADQGAHAGAGGVPSPPQGVSYGDA